MLGGRYGLGKLSFSQLFLENYYNYSKDKRYNMEQIQNNLERLRKKMEQI